MVITNIFFNNNIDLLDEVEYDGLLTRIPPDAPYFIRSTIDYNEAFMNFVKRDFGQYKFYVDPSPSKLQDISMNQKITHQWFRNVIR